MGSLKHIAQVCCACRVPGASAFAGNRLLLHVRFVHKFQMLTTGLDVCPFSMVLTMDGGFSRKGISVSQCGKS